MMSLCLALFVASLLGSGHCAGMCGAFVAFAVGAGQPQTPFSRTALQVAYHVGRLSTYLFLGAMVGAFGEKLEQGGMLMGITRFAAITSGTLMVVFGLISLLRLAGVEIRAAKLPGFLQRWNLAGHRLAMRLGPVQRATAIGLLTTFLPCGWLWAFLITAAGTASPFWGAMAMAWFWLGTLPVMVGLGMGLQLLVGRRVPLALLASLLVTLMGIGTIRGRLIMPLPSLAQPEVKIPTQPLKGCCQER